MFGLQAGLFKRNHRLLLEDFGRQYCSDGVTMLERIRILSSVVLHTPSDLMKMYFKETRGARELSFQLIDNSYCINLIG